MCATCGCSTDRHEHDHHSHHGDHHHHEHDGHEHVHPQPLDSAAKRVELERRVLAKNDALAARNRELLAERRLFAVNLVSSPGAGKTTLLERTIAELGKALPIHVIEGDQETERDAQRIRAAGARAVQVNTGTGCHLDAEMTAGALAQLAPEPGSLVLIENVGNLVCPALFDLGEHAKVVVASVTEGEDKPIKYPHMFRASRLMVLNKIDLLPHLSFDVDRCLAFAHEVNPQLRVLCLSATRGDGLEEWYGWLEEACGTAAAQRAMIASAGRDN
jgi:hydrogenase nickel incorporation protein HypB